MFDISAISAAHVRYLRDIRLSAMHPLELLARAQLNRRPNSHRGQSALKKKKSQESNTAPVHRSGLPLHCLAHNEYASIKTVSRGGKGIFGAEAVSQTVYPSM
jgi:hypothetical protein